MCQRPWISYFLPKIPTYFQANKLSINIKKINVIRVKTKQNRQKLDLHFPINDIEIDRVNKVLFLRVILDEHLSWKSQTQNVARKVSKSVVIINKSVFCLNVTNTLKWDDHLKHLASSCYGVLY